MVFLSFGLWVHFAFSPIMNIHFLSFLPRYLMNGEIQETPLGFMFEIRKTGSPSFFPGEFVLGIVEDEFQTQSRLRVKIRPNVPRFSLLIYFYC